jgi:phosphoglycerol transferase MdoB-like AlkP superfamily enzyme
MAQLFRHAEFAPMTWWKSRRIQFLAGCIALFLALFLVLRAIFYFGFSEVGASVHPDIDTLFKTLYIGFKFDLRLAILVTLPLFVMAYLPRVNLVTSATMRGIAQVYLALAIVVLMGFYILDFGHYAYLGIRINSTVMRFAEDATISAVMVWESYPVVWIALGWIATVVVFVILLRKLERATLQRPGEHITGKQVAVGSFIVIVLMIGGLLGRFANFNIQNPVPLRWNHAFFSGNAAVAALGLNPVLFFFDTFEQREAPYDPEQVKKYYNAVADYLGVVEQNPESLNYDRIVGPQPHKIQYERSPNVVFVMLESLGASRLGVHGNPLKPTPNLDEIAENGWFFPNFYVPVSGTARTVFASITGLPDVSSVETATRNPLIAEQRIVLNSFKDYRKYYFIGGSAGWANMSAVINQSIKDVEMYEENYWESPIVDVWGISDLSLFREVDQFLSRLPGDKPFFAYVQTAGNHRPFTIPEDNDGFVIQSETEENLQKSGFRSVEQFNAVRLIDFNIGRFMEFAKRSGYFDNTIFVFFGDHNNRITSTPFRAPFYEALDLDGLNVPHMIYAPKLLQHRVIEDATSLVDMFPTVAGILGIEYLNSTMGRDVNMPAPEGERVVYTQTADKRFPVIGAITKDYMVRMNSDGSEAKMHDLKSATPVDDVSAQFPDEFKQMGDIARGIYETTKFQFYNNTVGEAQRRSQE